ncbi:glycosyltransferase family 4 protein [Novosphingobium colocasiae]|uniref:glycosyltransferase family 4 protein n=1 Tax=Novosphingobium colocasiae TaxID=1256513 RepID=UPI0035B221C5
MNSIPFDVASSHSHAAADDGDTVRSLYAALSSRSAPPRRVALVGTYRPRMCGIATFTADLHDKLAEFHPDITVDVYPLCAADTPADAPRHIAEADPDSYARAARHINESGADALWLQHEYGIFGGPDGEMVCDFVDRVAAPLILTCHTVLSHPSERQRAILHHLVARASQIMVMSSHSLELLVAQYGARREVLTLIEHGAPDRPFGRQGEFKASLDLSGRKVLMTFGLLGPGKGLETAIRALPAIIARHPEVLYRIVGATHPNLVSQEGEAYRESLEALARDLGVTRHIQWDNRFLETEELLDQLEASDVYLTPYPGLQQSTSGTLSYAVALGKAVISTPYLHARELLAHDVGRLVEPGSSAAIAAAVNALFDEPEALLAMQRRAYRRGRETIWPRFAGAAARLVETAAAPAPNSVSYTATPGLRGFYAMCDATGMLQHAIGIVPDRNHGYCLDDNARALMLMNALEGIDPAERMRWSMVFSAFVQHAWNPDLGLFRNFMRFDRGWCEDMGSQDSNGRAVWALGDTVERSDDPDLVAWALQLYERVLPSLAGLESPRTLAFVALGACAVLRRRPDHDLSRECVRHAGEALMGFLESQRRPGWHWFESVLAYDNPRLSQALTEAGSVMGESGWIDEALASLRWICGIQTSASGHFRPIGSETFGLPETAMPFDQQPLEAQAAIEAAAVAYELTGDVFWRDHACMAYAWFFGANDRGAVLADLTTGRCRDGVTPRGANLNCGAESILAFQLSNCRIRSIVATTRTVTEGNRLEPTREVSV